MQQHWLQEEFVAQRGGLYRDLHEGESPVSMRALLINNQGDQSLREGQAPDWKHQLIIDGAGEIVRVSYRGSFDEN